MPKSFCRALTSAAFTPRSWSSSSRSCAIVAQAIAAMAAPAASCITFWLFKSPPFARRRSKENLVGLFVLQSFGVDRLAVLRAQEVVGKAQYLKAVAITDDPKIQLTPFAVGGRDLHKA